MAAERYDHADIEAFREDMIMIRDEALKQGEMEWSIILSHVVKALAQYMDDIVREGL